MKIAEIFYSIQGEGLLSGRPSVFVRTAGCPLRCDWCDTKTAWDTESLPDTEISQIIAAIKEYPCNNIVITGGEPLIQPQISELTTELKNMGKHITIETAAINYVDDLSCDLVSISPKLANSGQYAANPRVIDRYIEEFPYQLKFVINQRKDLPEIQHLLDKLKRFDINRILLMPQASTKQQLLEKSPQVVELCKETGFTFTNRLHIMLWSDKKGV